MEYKAKIVQIIEEKKHKSYGLPTINGVDWINVEPAPKLNNKSCIWFLLFFIGGFILGLFLNSFNKYLSLLSVLIAWGIGTFFMYRELKQNKKLIPGGYWYFNSPIPIKKPHEFKLGDIVYINLQVENEPTKL